VTAAHQQTIARQSDLQRFGARAVPRARNGDDIDRALVVKNSIWRHKCRRFVDGIMTIENMPMDTGFESAEPVTFLVTCQRIPDKSEGSHPWHP